jgi:hypothetical protein
MSQLTINQRIKFLLDNYKLSVRSFSELIGHKPANTQNYVGARGSMPGADYLQSITEHFEDVNPIWLLTGMGEPFKEGSAPTQNQTNISGKKNTVAVAGTNNGTATTNNYTISECERDRDAYKAERDHARQQVEHLQAQLATKDALIASKEETIELLKVAFNRPN